METGNINQTANFKPITQKVLDNLLEKTWKTRSTRLQESHNNYSLVTYHYNRKHMDSFNSPTTKSLYKGTQIVWYVLGIIETFLAFRFILKLLGANPDAGFSAFVYSITYIFASPFLNVFHVVSVRGSVLEWTTILAMIVYWIIAFGIIKLFLMSKTVSIPEAAVELNNQEN